MINANLENLIKLYKENKINEYVLEKELTLSVQKNVRCSVKIIEDIIGSTNSTFGITSLPEKKNGILYITYLIDKALIKNFLSEEEVLTFLFNEIKNTQTIFSYFTKFLIEKKDTEISLRESIIFFLNIYFISLKAIPENIKEKLYELKALPSYETLKNEVDALNNEEEPLEEIIEKLKINDTIPNIFLEEAKKISEESLKQEEPIIVDLNLETAALTTNKNFDRIASYSSNAYNNLKREIPYDYYPSTNQ